MLEVLLALMELHSKKYGNISLEIETLEKE